MSPSNPSEQFNTPPNVPEAHQRPRNLRPRCTTPLCTHINPWRSRRIAITILPHTHKSDVAASSRRAANRARLQRVRFIAPESGGVEAHATALGFASTRTARGPVVVAETQELAVGIAGGGGTDAVGAGAAYCALVAAGAAVVIGGA
jgi:hypothetical protein